MSAARISEIESLFEPVAHKNAVASDGTPAYSNTGRVRTEFRSFRDNTKCSSQNRSKTSNYIVHRYGWGIIFYHSAGLNTHFTQPRWIVRRLNHLACQSIHITQGKY